MVVGVLKVVYEMGIDVFGELFVVGFDDNLFVLWVILLLIMVQCLVVVMVGLVVKKIVVLIENKFIEDVDDYIVKLYLIIWEFICKVIK